MPAFPAAACPFILLHLLHQSELATNMLSQFLLGELLDSINSLKSSLRDVVFPFYPYTC